jgi:hypothetical protein
MSGWASRRAKSASYRALRRRWNAGEPIAIGHAWRSEKPVASFSSLVVHERGPSAGDLTIGVARDEHDEQPAVYEPRRIEIEIGAHDDWNAPRVTMEGTDQDGKRVVESRILRPVYARTFDEVLNARGLKRYRFTVFRRIVLPGTIESLPIAGSIAQ